MASQAATKASLCVTRAESAARTIICPHCDRVNLLPALKPGFRARCTCCATLLATHLPQRQTALTLYALAALFMQLLANSFPFIHLEAAGLSHQIVLADVLRQLSLDGFNLLACLFLFGVQLIPTGCMVIILLLLYQRALPLACKRILARLPLSAKAWGMAEIFTAGVLVSFVKLIAYGEIGLGLSFWAWCLFCLLQLRTLYYLDRAWLWQYIAPLPAAPVALKQGESGIQQHARGCLSCTAPLSLTQRRCPRCGVCGGARRMHSLQLTMALLLTACLLYVPANILPIMSTQTAIENYDATIFSGVVLLWRSGSYPIALIIFVASIVVPSAKIAALAWLCWRTKRVRVDERYTALRIYAIVEFIGRWSMIDLFVVAVLAALVRLAPLMQVSPAIGTLPFAGVVILSMLAATTYDPRLLWDEASTAPIKERASVTHH